MSNMMTLTEARTLWLALLLASCSRTPLSPSEPAAISDIVRAEWALAQEKIGGLASSVRPERFRWVEHVGMFACPGVAGLKQGCFGPDAPGGPQVDWDTAAPSILRHEAGHSILWALGDPDWSCYEHDDPTNGNFEERCVR